MNLNGTSGLKPKNPTTFLQGYSEATVQDNIEEFLSYHPESLFFVNSVQSNYPAGIFSNRLSISSETSILSWLGC